MSRTALFLRIWSIVSSTSTAPWCITVTVRAIIRTNCMSCSTTMSACVRLISRTSSAVRATSSCVMPAAGSSSRINSGLPASTVPSSTHWRRPCERRPTMPPAIAPSPTRSMISSVMASARGREFVRRAASHR